MYKKPITSWFKHLDFILIDLVSLNLSFMLAYSFRFGYNKLIYNEYIYQNVVLFASVVNLALSIILHTHDNILRRSFLLELKSVVLLSVIDLLLMTFYLFSLHISNAYSRIVIHSAIVFFLFIDLVLRLLWKNLLLKTNGKLNFHKEEKKALIYTEKKYVDKIVNAILNDKFVGFIIEGIVVTDIENSEKIIKKYVIVNEEDIIDFLVENSINDVIIYTFKDDEKKENLLISCHEMGLTTHEIISLSKYNNSNSFVENIGKYYIMTRAFSAVPAFDACVKRIIDIIGGLIGAIFAMVLYIVVGPFIYFNSPGPIIYKQVRVGKNGKKFVMYKFRSMIVNADKEKEKYMGKNIMSGNMFKLDFDPRIIGNKILPDGTKKTGIGNFIRKTSIDEFPQFFNVLKGDMSIVGTRPPTYDEWVKYENHHRARLAWKPGITGLWQVSGRNQISDFEEIVKLDTEYISNFSLGLDIKIILKTFLKFLKFDGK